MPKIVSKSEEARKVTRAGDSQGQYIIDVRLSDKAETGPILRINELSMCLYMHT